MASEFIALFWDFFVVIFYLHLYNYKNSYFALNKSRLRPGNFSCVSSMADIFTILGCNQENCECFGCYFLIEKPKPKNDLRDSIKIYTYITNVFFCFINLCVLFALFL